MALAGIIKGFEEVVAVGETVLGAEARSKGYIITVNMEVDNLSNVTLMYPGVSLKSGECDVPPVRIASGYKEAMLARKYSYMPSGSFGVVSWQIGETKNRVVIMWSVPFNSFFYDNWLAVGIKPAKDHDPKWADEMYYEKYGSWYQRAKYNTEVPTVSFITDKWAVSASMSTTQGAHVRATFGPTNESDVSQYLKDKKAQQK
ncbi:hypothetical protein DPMN_067885 [Dreissena polymorpha]|uniref:Uncharacterized protein n=1 Tax=Dreissena polymorpha TaxID=45954 RepID=A0A9D3Z1H7_DREPO|nr:hypothetical protein DPMN_067885 [Dreissena polymorpha]